LLFRFRGAGFGFAGELTTARALFTTFSTADRADVDEPRKMSPIEIKTREITRMVGIWLLEFVLEAKGFSGEFMGGAPYRQCRVNGAATELW